MPTYYNPSEAFVDFIVEEPTVYLDTDLTISVTPEKVDLGEPVSIAGTLKEKLSADPMVSHQVEIWCQKPGASACDFLITNVVTDMNGEFTTDFTPDQVGFWRFEDKFIGTKP